MTSPVAPTLELYASQTGLKTIGTIAMPVRDHINTATHISFSHTDWSFLGPGEEIHRVHIQGSMLPLQRNEAIQRMQGNFLIFLDDDMVWEPQAIGQLIDAYDELQSRFEEPVMVGGLCFRRHFPYQPTLYMRERPDSGGYHVPEEWEDGYIEVDATGCAFLLISVRAIEAATDAEMPPYEIRQGFTPPPIFRQEGKIGEDVRFCQDAKAGGVRIFVDTRIEVRHVTEVQVGKKDFLTSLALRSPEEETRARFVNELNGLPTVGRVEARSRLGWT